MQGDVEIIFAQFKTLVSIMGGYSTFKKIQSNGKIKHSSVDYMVWFGYLIKLFCLSAEDWKHYVGSAGDLL